MKGVIHWIIILGLLCATAVSSAEKPGDLSGNWKIHTTSHRGYETWKLKSIPMRGNTKSSPSSPIWDEVNAL